jgi:hypothetical protein
MGDEQIARMTPEQLAERAAKIRTALDDTWADLDDEPGDGTWAKGYILGRARGLQQALAILLEASADHG